MNRTLKLLNVTLAAAAGAHIFLFCLVAFARLGYPYDLEWMEGGVRMHMARILEGRPLYVAPTFRFVPFIYPPLYYHASALAARVLGTGFLPLRLVSFVSALGCLGLIFALVRRETGSRRAAWLGAGLYAAAFPLTGFWFDLARVDSLFMVLALGGVFALRSGGRHAGWAQALGGLLFAAAFFAKQTALMIAMPLALHALAFEPWRRKWIFPLAAAGPVALGTLLLDRATQGWFSFYIFKLPAHHALDDYHLWRFWALDLAAPLPVACGLGVLFLAVPGSITRSTRAFYALLAAGAVGAAYSSRLHSAGFSNVVMPAYAALAVLFGLAVARFVYGWHGRNGQDDQNRQDALAMVLVLVQFAMLYYDPRPQIPTREDRQTGDAFVARLRAERGEVLVPYHDYLPWLAGKPPHAHLMAVNDVVRGDPERGQALLKEIHDSLKARRWAVIYLDSEWYPDWLEESYESVDYAFGNEHFMTRVGMRIRPGTVYKPKSDGSNSSSQLKAQSSKQGSQFGL